MGEKLGNDEENQEANLIRGLVGFAVKSGLRPDAIGAALKNIGPQEAEKIGTVASGGLKGKGDPKTIRDVGELLQKG